MELQVLRRLLGQVQAGAVSPYEALAQVKDLPYTDLGYARVDNHRALRTGFPEVVFCQGKTPQQAAVPHAVYHPLSRLVTAFREPVAPRWPGLVAVLSAGTADLPVAEEAAVTAALFGCRLERAHDVGVAGLHRLLDQFPLLRRAAVIIAVTGMEGRCPPSLPG